MADKNSGLEVIGGFLTGAIMGIALGMLFAPSAGKETRERLGDWMAEGKDKAQEKLEELEKEIKRRKEQLLKKTKEETEKVADDILNS